eukprot:TRINITY_DN12716_c1_g1_i1.p1 TRINITY_DN12716_c1_g1~~TRINITY_DN12716_c1_g1_i1.p1  ORF type:complete len:424 (+),score=67.80 TRINITY_DN12716_c1_g1_i1:69-1340(+)
MVKLKFMIVLLMMYLSVEGESSVDPAPMEAQVTVLLNMFDEPSRKKLGWGVNAPCQDGPYPGWTGVSCNQESTGIVMINIPNFGVNGTLPAMKNLTGLSELLLGGNGIVGSLPESLPPLLHTLDVSSNYLNGTIPRTISNLTFLERLDLSANSLNGDIPYMGSLGSLSYLSLGNNALVGSIPEELSSLNYMTQISLFGNEFDGTLPAGLGNLPALSILYVYGNRLSGTVPKNLGSSTSLTRLYLDTNDFVGVLPAFTNVLKGKLEKLTLADNDWECPLPNIDGSVWIDKADTTCDNDQMPVWVIACFICGGVLLIVASAIFIRKIIKRRRLEAEIAYSSEDREERYPTPPPHEVHNSSSRSHDPTVSLFANVSSAVFNAEHDEAAPSQSTHTPSRSSRSLNASFIRVSKTGSGTFPEGAVHHN